MAGESAILYTPGAGGKAAAYQRTVGGNAVDEPIVIEGESYLPSYIALAVNPGLDTANSHLLQLMAGSSLNLRVRRIVIDQGANATTAAVGAVEVWRVTTAGTGGTAITPAPLDTADGPSGATARSLPTAKGTESTVFWQFSIPWRNTAPVSGGVNSRWEWTPQPGMKPLIVPAGTTNGIVIKLVTAIANATCDAWIEFAETLWL